MAKTAAECVHVHEGKPDLALPVAEMHDINIQVDIYTYTKLSYNSLMNVCNVVMSE
jgi:hypothetical protein